MTSAERCQPSSLSAELRVATGRLHRALRRQRGEAGLSEGQFATLAALSKHGPLTLGVLAEREGMRPPSMTRIAQALTEMDLVCREEHPGDARQIVVTLTEKGRATMRDIRRRQDDWLTARLAKLERAERERLADACALLLKLTER